MVIRSERHDRKVISVMGKRISRRDERINVMTHLFSYSFRPDEDPECILTDNDIIPTEYEQSVFLGAVDFIPEADKMIEADSKRWKVSRLSPITSAVLHLAVYELIKTDVPPKAVINEAVELAKIYDDSSAPPFVNGILNRIAREHGLFESSDGEIKD